jgi:hypothetical protein
MKRNRATAVSVALILAGLVCSVSVNGRVCAGGQAASMEEASTPAPVNAALPANDPATIGQWSTPISLGMVPIHAVLLRNNQLLFWQYLNGTSNDPGTVAILFNPANQQVTSIPTAPTDDFFCSGATQMSDGRLLIDGGLAGPIGHGAFGTSNATIFDPSTNTFTAQPNMFFARYYPTNIAMPDGTQLVVSGENASAQITPQLEKWDPTTQAWVQLPATANLPKWSEPWDNYPRMFLLPSGNLYVANQLYHTWTFNPTSYVWTFLGNYDNVYRFHGAQVLMPDLATVMVMGGQPPLGLPSATTETINLSSGTPTWTYGTPMNLPRHDLNAVQLPDGTILAVGGAAGVGKYADPVKPAELYTPSTKQWTTLASQMGSRGYHSTALLLTDGTVISAGSDSGDQYQTYAEIFSPPYLFKGPRPVISSAPAMMQYGQAFTVSTPTPSAISSVALIRLDALTHADHMDQRMLNLSFTMQKGSLRISAPANANYAPPGFYMLFLLNSNGVPSIAKILQVSPVGTRHRKLERLKPSKQ